jgi:N-acetylglucosamine-6-phosphate deacetylase
VADQALRNLVDVLGLDLAEASQRVSTHAARYLGLADRGELRVGAVADAVVLDAQLVVRHVIVEGQDLDVAEAISRRSAPASGAPKRLS